MNKNNKIKKKNKPKMKLYDRCIECGKKVKAGPFANRICESCSIN